MTNSRDRTAERRDASCPSDGAALVGGILDRPDAELDYAFAKLAFDRFINPSVDVAAVHAELDKLAEMARRLAGPTASADDRLAALRRTIYENGPWNGGRPFAYDHSNARGQNVRLKLLSYYLDTRLGDCVSMPVLFLILADKLGLDVAFSLAPNHLFVKHRRADGLVINLEPTSGANPARDEWLRQVRPMSDRSIESGMYLRPLSKREGIAAMGISMVQYLREQRRFEEMAALCETILASNPRDGLVLINLAIACRNMGMRLLERYWTESAIPLNLRPYYWQLIARHDTAFSTARDLGWELTD